MEQATLSDRQVAHFKTFGFTVMRRVLTPDELSICAGELELALDTAYAHKPFDGAKKQVVTTMGPKTPFMAELLEDPRFVNAAERLGGDVLGVISDVNRRVGDTLWHPDSDAGHPSGVKFTWMFESMGETTGAARFIPGSHLNPYHDALKEILFPFPPPGEPPKIPIASVPAYACESEPGDVVAFDPRTWHSNVGGADGRRLCTLHYQINPKTPHEEAWARTFAEGVACVPWNHDRPGERWFHPEWLENRGGSKLRQRWIDRLSELGFFTVTGHATV